ncbi:hypothetical protein JCGZ_06748 [Jatropha curcas]|uniref:Uncharacterized protein n=1 Tax=Jatropha curcas TaxID=180498 RepID=A0A067KZN7_JATCU|nr:hypothetical protein JCGZ_06748 [Jatropha curcas]
MAFGPVGLFAVQENWLFEPQNLGIHRRLQPLSPVAAAVFKGGRENWIFEPQNLSIHSFIPLDILTISRLQMVSHLSRTCHEHETKVDQNHLEFAMRWIGKLPSSVVHQESIIQDVENLARINKHVQIG